MKYKITGYLLSFSIVVLKFFAKIIVDRYYPRIDEYDNCLEKCHFHINDGVHIGSVSCKECSYNLHQHDVKHKNTDWIKCLYIHKAKGAR